MASPLENEDVVGEWKRERVLGAGGFGMVVLWRNLNTSQHIALKQIRWANDPMLTPKHKQRWTQEVDIMKRLSHPNVVSAVDVPEILNVTNDGLPLLAMEYCTGGDLRKVITRAENCCGLSEIEIRTLLQQVSSALRHLHNLRIIHRDLKPENIVLQEMDGKIVYKLIDLGYAKELDQSSLCTSFVGTLQYLAPELFMSQKYTSTVDYWSLGLVAHECITGFRPFFPTMSPAQWIPHVMKKRSEQICGFFGSDGNIEFSSELVPENHISGPLKKQIEGWLAVMLEWDPQNRGCIIENGKKEVIAFTMLDSILSKKILTVFRVHTCQYLWYEVNRNTTMGHVVQWVTTDSKMSKSDMLFLLQQGIPLDFRKGALQYWSEPEEEEWILYAFDRNSDEIPRINPTIPPLVEKMFRNSTSVNTYEERRKMWIHSVFFISQERALYRRLIQAQKVLMMHLLSRNSVIYNMTTKMVRELNKLKAKLELFDSSLHCDILKYENQAQNGGITSNIMFQNWVRTQDISKKISQLHERVLGLEGKATIVNTKTIELQRSPYARNKVPQVLEEMYEKALTAYDALRKLPKEHRQIALDNTEMITLLLTCLKNRERLLRDIYLHLQKLMGCVDEVQQLIGPMEAMLTEINDHEKQLEVLQKERQTDIWKLVENLCKKIRAIKSGTLHPSFFETSLTDSVNSAQMGTNMDQSNPSSMNNSLMASCSSSTDNSNSQIKLSSILSKSFQELPSLLHENTQLRNQLLNVQENLFKVQDEAVSLHDSADWNFLDAKLKSAPTKSTCDKPSQQT